MTQWQERAIATTTRKRGTRRAKPKRADAYAHLDTRMERNAMLWAIEVLTKND